MASADPAEREVGEGEAVWARRAFLVAVALVVAPFLLSAIAVLRDGPGAFFSDRAVMELAVRDVGRHPVLIGLYSRGGWSHPGPLIYYMLALPYRLTGSNPAGLLVGALAVNALAVVGMGVVAKRLGGLAAGLLTLLGASVVTHALGPQVLRDPWVCFVTVVPFGLFCVLAWAMTEQRAWALPAAVAVATWLTQTHVGFAPLTAPALVVGAVWLWVHARRAHDPDTTRRVVRATAVAAVVLVGLWIPPLWDQVLRSGNLGKTIRWFAAGHAVHTMAEGARVVLAQLAAAPDWVTGTRRFSQLNGETSLRTTTLWPVLVVPFAAAAAVAWRRGDRAIVRLAGVVAFTIAVAIVAVARTSGVMYEYRILWTWLPGMLAGVVIAWTIWNAIARRWPRSTMRVLTPVAMLALGALCAVQLSDVAQAGPFVYYSPATASVTRQVARKLDPHGGEVLVRSASSISEWYRQGLVLGLERDGFDARVVSDDVGFFGSSRVARGGPVQARLVVMTDGDIAQRAPGPDLELIAYSGPVPLRERVRLVRRELAAQARLLDDVESGKIGRSEFNRRFGATKLTGDALAVYREP
jgi:hypothetical protein